MSSFEHLYFVPAMQGMLQVPGNTAAPWGHLRWVREGPIHSGAHRAPPSASLNLPCFPPGLGGSSLILVPSPQSFIWSPGDCRWSPSGARV